MGSSQSRVWTHLRHLLHWQEDSLPLSHLGSLPLPLIWWNFNKIYMRHKEWKWCLQRKPSNLFSLFSPEFLQRPPWPLGSHFTGQCCFSAQTEISEDSAKRHTALWTPGRGLQWNETSPTLPLSAGHGMYILGMDRSFSYLDWRASEVAQCLLREIVPRFGFPTSIGSDNGPAFIADSV